MTGLEQLLLIFLILSWAIYGAIELIRPNYLNILLIEYERHRDTRRRLHEAQEKLHQIHDLTE